MSKILYGESATLALGKILYRAMGKPCLVYLYGDLGAGKTTCVRGFLNEGGYRGPVKSPTFTLVEEYEIDKFKVIHFDLYRLSDPEELEWIGIRDYFEVDVVCFIEWPNKGIGYLPAADLEIRLSGLDESRAVEWAAHSLTGKAIIANMEKTY